VHMTSQSPRSKPAACSSKRPLQRLPQSLCPPDDMGTTFYPYFTFSQYSSAHRKLSS
ncbi:Neurobeachin, partial [Manis pentadactyla]